MKRLLQPLLTAALLCTALPGVARANTTPIVADVNADWTHESTGTQFPVQIAGFTREDLNDFGSTQSDIAGTYHDRIGEVTATFYLFKTALPDPSIWHERILAVMNAGQLGPMDLHTAVDVTFAPPGETVASGWRSTVKAHGSGVISSGLSIWARGKWLIAVRMSSRKLEQSELDRRLAAFSAAVVTGEHTPSTFAAYVVEPCSRQLPTKTAKRLKPNMASSLMQSLLHVTRASKGDQKATASVHCRASSNDATFAAYAAADQKTGYVVAFGDAGAAAFVSEDTLGAEIAKTKAGGYTLNLALPDTNLVYLGFEGEPALEQVVSAINSERPVSSSSRAGGDSTISISP